MASNMVEAFFKYLPSPGLGDAARQHLIDSVKRSTPGIALFVDGKTFLSYSHIFFPRTVESKGEYSVKLSSPRLPDIAVALLCGAIRRNASARIRTRLDSRKIDAALEEYNQGLRQAALKFYIQILKETKEFKKVAPIGGGPLRFRNLRKQYMEILEDRLRVHLVAFMVGKWPGVHREILYHYIKLIYLGSSHGDIDLFADYLTREGVLPSDYFLGKGRWESYFIDMEFCPTVSISDIEEEALAGIRRTGTYFERGNFPHQRPENELFSSRFIAGPGSEFNSAW